MLLAIFQGQSTHGDYFIYHDYAALLLTTHDRLDQDLFAAGLQSYLNPYGFWPLALMLEQNWPAVLIAATLAALHAISAIFLYLACSSLSRSLVGKERNLMLCGWLLGATTPVLLGTLGTTFLDPLLTVPLAASLWLLVREQELSPATAFSCCFLAAASAGLKLTHAPFVIAMAIVVAAPARSQNCGLWLSRIILGATGAFFGFVLAAGPWAWKLWKRFDNPLFPFFNSVFNSAWFSPHNLKFDRFIPDTAQDWAAWPFTVALPTGWTYVEPVMPDLRPAALTLLVVSALFAACRRATPNALRWLSSRELTREARFWIFFFSGLIFWMLSSANGRYGIIALMAVGPAIVLIAVRTFSVRTAAVICWLVVCIHVLNLVVVGVGSWGSRAWSRHWNHVDVPAELVREPHLFISPDTSVKSFVARAVHQDSQFVQLVGTQFSVPSASPTSDWIMQAIDANERNVHLLAQITEAPAAHFEISEAKKLWNSTLNRMGLVVGPAPCLKIHVNRDEALPIFFNKRYAGKKDATLISCPVEMAQKSKTLDESYRLAATIFSSMEKRCPNVFYPPGGQIEVFGRVLRRTYSYPDTLVVSLSLYDNTIKYQLMGRATQPTLIDVATWRDDVEGLRCDFLRGLSRGGRSVSEAGLKGSAG